jgi:hypothetical protein
MAMRAKYQKQGSIRFCQEAMMGMTTRRNVLKNAAAGATGLLILRNSKLAWSAAANERVNVAMVGVGGRGEWFVDTIPRMANVVAIVDVNQQKLDKAFEHWAGYGKQYSASAQDWEQRAGKEFLRLAENKPKTFADFRVMLEQMGKSVDAVVVATPDHSHAVASAAAIRAGKHVFCEKPLTRTVQEARTLRALARQYKVATTMGNQGTYCGPFRRAVELIRGGQIGDVTEVHVWNTGGGVDRKAPPPAEGVPVPAYLNWDLWLGPAANRPYHPMWIQRHSWREFGTNALGNWGPHSANLGFIAMNVHELWLNEPKEPRPIVRIEAKTSGINKLSFPKWEWVKWHVPARGSLPPITINWYNGEFPEARALRDRATAGGTEKDRSLWQFGGTFIVGTKGSIHTTAHNMSFRLLPEDQFKGVQRDRPETLENTRGPEQDWLAACRGGKEPWSTMAGYGSALNEFLMLGNVATQFDSAIEYDPAAGTVINNKQADALLKSEYREGWKL